MVEVYSIEFQILTRVSSMQNNCQNYFRSGFRKAAAEWYNNAIFKYYPAVINLRPSRHRPNAPKCQTATRAHYKHCFLPGGAVAPPPTVAGSSTSTSIESL